MVAANINENAIDPMTDHIESANQSPWMLQSNACRPVTTPSAIVATNIQTETATIKNLFIRFSLFSNVPG